MKIFLDTANLDQIKEAVSWGIIDGVTTNPTLCSREKENFNDLIKKICDVVPGPVSVECVESHAEGIVKEARKHCEIAENVIVKIPICVEGLKATRRLSDEGIHVNTTLVFSPTQALLAAKAGSRYVSPFVGRLDDISSDGMALVEQLVPIFNNYGFETEIIVASIRHPMHVVEAALMGADIATLPFNSLEKLVKHPLTDRGIERFLDDWEKVKKAMSQKEK
ncbi:MAG TPA: fructose-6-phosphate aldolase [Candidatus Aminicenantes bacterium]|nr:fructose-6-phosphate aldolase [Candidatus Aminicenantes bacterium]